LLDETIDNVVDVVFELDEEAFVFVLGEGALKILTNGFDISCDGDFLVLIDEIEPVIFTQHFFETDKVRVVEVLVYSGHLLVKVDIFLGHVFLLQLHVGAARVLSLPERITTIVGVQNFHYFISIGLQPTSRLK